MITPFSDCQPSLYACSLFSLYITCHSLNLLFLYIISLLLFIHHHHRRTYILSVHLLPFLLLLQSLRTYAHLLSVLSHVNPHLFPVLLLLHHLLPLQVSQKSFQTYISSLSVFQRLSYYNIHDYSNGSSYYLKHSFSSCKMVIC